MQNNKRMPKPRKGACLQDLRFQRLQKAHPYICRCPNTATESDVLKDCNYMWRPGIQIIGRNNLACRIALDDNVVNVYTTSREEISRVFNEEPELRMQSISDFLCFDRPLSVEEPLCSRKREDKTACPKYHSSQMHHKRWSLIPTANQYRLPMVQIFTCNNWD